MIHEHYYSKRQKSLLNIKKIRQKINNIKFEFYTASGVFSKDKIDKGTLVLAENMLAAKDSKILDIGCGIGILGIVAAKLFNAYVVMSDINKRAANLAKMNIDLNKVKGKVCEGNLYEPIQEKDFDVVLLNPPQTAGKDICFQMIIQAKKYLSRNGSLQLVARNNKGGKTFSNKMQKVFGNASVIAKKSGYWVYMGVN